MAEGGSNRNSPPGSADSVPPMADHARSLAALLGEWMTKLLRYEPCPSHFLEEILGRLRLSSVSELEEGLHVLWPFTRHLTREECQKALYFAIQDGVGVPPPREDVKTWMEDYEAEREALLPELLEK